MRARSVQARRRTLSASSTGPLGCLSAGISSVGRLNRMPRYAFRSPTLYLPRRKSNAGRMECEKCGLDPGTRELIEYPYIIVYEVHEDRGDVVVLSVVHGAQARKPREE